MTALGLPQPELVKVASATTGTGTLTLGSASSGFMGVTQLVNSSQYFYTIIDGTNAEVGLGTYTTSGTTLSRDTVIRSVISGTEGTTKLTCTGSQTVTFGMSGAQAGSLYALGYGGLSGMAPKWTSNTVLGCGSGAYYVESLGYAVYAAPADITPATPTASSIYHIYGTPAGAIEASLTAPVAFATPTGTARSKSGDASRRYLYSAITDASSHFYQFRYQQTINCIRWLNPNSGPFTVLSGGAAVTSTTIDCSGAAPTTATSLILGVVNLAAAFTLLLGTNDIGAISVSNYFDAVAAMQSPELIFPCDTSQKLAYVYTGTPAGSGLTLEVRGYGLSR